MRESVRLIGLGEPLSHCFWLDWLMLTDCQSDWSMIIESDRQTPFLTDCLIGWLIDWLTDCLTDWLADLLTDWLTDWLTESDWLITEWMEWWACVLEDNSIKLPIIVSLATWLMDRLLIIAPRIDWFKIDRQWLMDWPIDLSQDQKAPLTQLAVSLHDGRVDRV